MTTPRRILRLFAALFAVTSLTALAACGSDSDDAATTDTTAAADTTTTAPGDGVVSDEGGLVIANPWARTSPMDTTYGAVYLELTSADDDALVGASVPADVAGAVEIHETVAADSSDTTMGTDMGTEATAGTDTTAAEAGGDTTETTAAGMGEMTMQPIDSLELPAGDTVVLEPGGYHIMLIDLVAPLETGQEIEVTLTFENAGERTITVPVRDDAP